MSKGGILADLSEINHSAAVVRLQLKRMEMTRREARRLAIRLISIILAKMTV